MGFESANFKVSSFKKGTREKMGIMKKKVEKSTTNFRKVKRNNTKLNSFSGHQEGENFTETSEQYLSESIQRF
jgi:hypothetical protein